MDYYNAQIDQINPDTVWHVILGESALNDGELLGDWWYGGAQWDINIFGNEFDLDLKENQRKVALYALDTDGNTLYDEPVKQFTIDLYKDKRQ